MLRLGREGYRLVHQACYDTAQYLAKRIVDLGPFELYFDGDSRNGIPAVSWTLRAGADAGYSLFDFSDRLRSRGWQVAAYTMVPNIEDVVVMRILVRHGFSRHMADLLLDDMTRTLDYFGTHPVTHKMNAADGTTHNHDAIRSTVSPALS
jgi:glutamate decarboxylase